MVANANGGESHTRSETRRKNEPSKKRHRYGAICRPRSTKRFHGEYSTCTSLRPNTFFTLSAHFTTTRASRASSQFPVFAKQLYSLRAAPSPAVRFQQQASAPS